MRKIKKVIALAATVCMVLTLTSCGDSEKENTNSASKENSGSMETSGADVNGDGKVIVGFIAKNLVDPFQTVLNTAVEDGVKKLMDEGIVDDWTGVLEGEGDAGKQIDRASECITKKCDIVIVLPAETTASDPVLTTLIDEGIKVLMVNAKTDSTDELATAYSGSDDVEAGEMLAQWVVEQVPEGGKYAHCLGVVGNSAQASRGEGIENIMSQNSKFESVGDYPCDWAADKAANVASDLINKYGDELVAIICDNDDMSSAAQQACNDAGREDVICIGVDGSQAALSMIKSGNLKGTILQDGASQVEEAIDVIRAMTQGEEFGKETMVPFITVTEENIDNYYTE